jgi:hypothetical protein
MSWRLLAALLALPCPACLPPRDDRPPQHEIDLLDELVRRERVSATLQRTSPGDFARVVVQVQGGTVVLEGEVPSTEARDLASHLARCVEGVQRVEDRLLVAPPPPPTGEQGD